MMVNTFFYLEGKYSSLELNAILLEKNSGLDNLIPKSFRVPSVWRFMVLTLWYILKNIAWIIIKVPKRYKFSCPDDFSQWYNNTTLFVLPTKNNQNALNKVIRLLNQNNFDYRLLKFENTPDCYPLMRMDLISLINLPFLWKDFYNSLYENRRIISFYMAYFVFSPGYPWFFFKVLSKYRPQCVIISNDHSCPTKCLELVCEDLNIKTIYVQHASVSYAFPELHFSYSFLDGMDALEKYTSDGKKSKGEIYLLGAVRYDELSSCRINRIISKRNCIGIAINEVDDNLIVNNICNKLLNMYSDVRIKIRAHPAMKNTPFLFDNTDRIIYTCAVDENIVEYLDSIDMQIAGDSGVHFDAIIGGVKTIAFNFSKNEYGDNYGYVRSGMVEYASNFCDLTQYINSQIEIDEKIVSYYDESFGKTYAGKCSEIIADFLMSGCNKGYIESKYNLTTRNNGKRSYFVIAK